MSEGGLLLKLRLRGTERSRALAPTRDELLAVARDAGAGSARAVETLILHVGGSMLATVRRVMGSRNPDVEDVLQDSVLALLDALRDFRGDCSVIHYANRVALLTALAARRRLHRRVPSLMPEPPVDLPAPEDTQSSPLDELLAARRRDALREVLDGLPEPMAQALALHFILGMTVEEIACAVDAPENTVWSRLRLGKRALRRKLQHRGKLAEALRGGAR